MSPTEKRSSICHQLPGVVPILICLHNALQMVTFVNPAKQLEFLPASVTLSTEHERKDTARSWFLLFRATDLYALRDSAQVVLGHC